MLRGETTFPAIKRPARSSGGGGQCRKWKATDLLQLRPFVSEACGKSICAGAVGRRDRFANWFYKKRRRSGDRRRLRKLRMVRERVMGRLAEDHVVEQPNAEDLPRLAKTSSERDVSRRGLGTPTRVVVADKHRGRVRDDRRLEDLAGV